ncbi:hypothetical protein [Dyadobacter sediminis]|uniref:Uncharacterized protein n=1 Tax=Dyadobacter sediminis TaxID=1493691 RepID=A0A5R9KHU0_9BACT|nr:hypothetical protein [Dyadobacter sediminis]TLU95791.1 hypothetical protein FEM55_01120 [Dyadobacter sediminis]GGB76584.1 hypothetical protein GCM10011325_00110 [Dyadobacter sediminis]
MDIKRRNFLQVVSLGLSTIATGFKMPESETAGSYTKSLSIEMPSKNGSYEFHVDGVRQIVNLVNKQGKLKTPAHSCEIRYMAEDGFTPLIVHIEQDASQLRLFPGSRGNASPQPLA